MYIWYHKIATKSAIYLFIISSSREDCLIWISVNDWLKLSSGSREDEHVKVQDKHTEANNNIQRTEEFFFIGKHSLHSNAYDPANEYTGHRDAFYIVLIMWTLFSVPDRRHSSRYALGSVTFAKYFPSFIQTSISELWFTWTKLLYRFTKNNRRSTPHPNIYLSKSVIICMWYISMISTYILFYAL